ncbi:MAG: riboflavin synthase subunit alpha [Fibrobacteria bacterium]|jgi:riboflavin synthase|nr:riboflavin synthase subunit alpha [Fibrobacteria bacterium]
MFTGIVQEMGKIVARSNAGEAVRFSIAAPSVASRLSVGDSVACDGACLTVETLIEGGFTACAIPETLAKTTLSSWTVGGRVNLETALTAAAPLGGHFVLGHVDGVGEVTAVNDLGDGGRELTVRLPEEFLPYCVYKGSITLAGVSLTIAAVEGDAVRVALIPHTLQATTLGLAVPGGRLNFEVDILAKHIERQLSLRAAAQKAPA